MLIKCGCSDLRIRGTYNSKTVAFLKNSIESLRLIGFSSIVFGIDYFDNGWNEESIDILRNTVQWLNSEKTKEVVIVEKNEIPQLCGGGVTSFYIYTDGNIYPCSYTVGKKQYRIGTVENGIDYKRVSALQDMYRRRIPECEDCANEYTCKTFKCKFLNEVLSGECLKASAILCAVENIQI